MSENEDFPTLTPFEHTFDYDKSVEQVLAACECNGWVDHWNITQKSFSVTTQGVVKRKGYYAHFGKNMSNAAVDAWCQKHSKRRGTAHETLTIGAEDKEPWPLVSGQTARFGDFYRVVCLREFEGQRDAFLGWIDDDDDDDWGSSCRFVIFDIEQPA